ncbi:hypothetical protein GCM10009550_32130 [Actinocorallia libanotica]|uniref:Uncharacterized protein n=1 Tax=Actinocorallia libanotica TaxID=46162 RepID=A0ABP4BMF8_9ACTN
MLRPRRGEAPRRRAIDLLADPEGTLLRIDRFGMPGAAADQARDAALVLLSAARRGRAAGREAQNEESDGL